MKLTVLGAVTALLLFLSHPGTAQIDSSLLKPVAAPADTRHRSLTMDAIYNRPFLQLGKSPVSIGGYVESDWQYVATSGISVGHQFQFRRFSLFVASTIIKHIKFLSEIEYENDPTGDPGDATAGQFEIEYAALDIEFHPLLNLRGGMIVNPIGAFNQNHDGPKWEFTDRPIAMSQMLPDTWSIMPAISFRPTAQTVLRFNYRRQETRDITGDVIGASLGLTEGYSVGLSTYF